ncbi:outer membrane protein TolC [Bradymonas sediminis]|uniref:Uncharacterized protein n=1 Tax=Bradymonas sediminis TaxID=1548548 RepID=A0A2Z4FN10_9DELT|nr:hypothetical protein DN745_13625 [Bradymonas sediminis]TDP75714.1 outer membrane protein TolC [Bradymonas sediminis]
MSKFLPKYMLLHPKKPQHLTPRRPCFWPGAAVFCAVSFTSLALAAPAFAQAVAPKETPEGANPAALLASEAADPSEGFESQTPKEVLERAMTHNPNLQAAVLAWRQAKLQVVSQDNQFVPLAFAEVGYSTGRRPYQGRDGVQLLSSDSIRFSTGLNQTFRSATRVGVSLEVERAAEDSIVLGDLDDTFGLGFLLTVSQPWLRGFGQETILAELHIAEVRRDAALAEQERQANALARQVLDAYWSLWFSEQQIRINQSALQLARQELKRAQEQFKVGEISASQMVSLETELARLTEDLVRSQATRQTQQFQLAALLGESPDKATLTPATEPPDVYDNLRRADLFAEAEKRSYELQSLKYTAEIARIQAALAKNRSLPSLSTDATVRVSGLGDDVPAAFEQIGGLEAISGNISLRLELPIINRAARADAERAALEVEIAETKYRAARDQLQSRVASTLSNFESAQSRLELAKKTATLAERQVEIQSTLFANGNTTMLDVVSAIQQRNQAQLRVASTRVEILKLRLELEEATGTLLERVSAALE